VLRGFPGGLALLLEGFSGLPVVWEIHLRCVLAGRRSFGRRELDGEREGGDETGCNASFFRLRLGGFAASERRIKALAGSN
jgi:hypothetical protein